jgi:hypothetical protein
MKLQQLFEAGPSAEEIFRRIKNVATSTDRPASPQTCWNKVGLFLRKNPDFKGEVYLYAIENDYINHALLVDENGTAVVGDKLGRMSADKKKFKATFNAGEMDLVQSRKWPY